MGPFTAPRFKNVTLLWFMGHGYVTVGETSGETPNKHLLQVKCHTPIVKQFARHFGLPFVKQATPLANL